MTKRAIQIGRVSPGHRFQADRYSFSERQRRRAASWRHKASVWWDGASFMERACRVLWLGVCGAVGITAGVIITALVFSPIVH